MKETRKDGGISNLQKILDEQRKEIFRLRYIIDNIPADVYWKDRKGVWLGVNKMGSDHLKKMGFECWKQSEVIGKTDHELFDKETADQFRANDVETMKYGGEITRKEESNILPSNKKVMQLSAKRPLRDEADNVVGIMGITVDITYLKQIENDLRKAKELAEETERLKLENEFNKNLAHIASQVVHDIRSPLTSLTLIVKSCEDIPEKKRIALREAANSIQDIANNLLNRYKNKVSETSERGRSQVTLVSARLLELLSEKKYEYEHIELALKHRITKQAYFAFIQIEASALKRMVSNLMNNAVEACNFTKRCAIDVLLEADEEHVKVHIKDNGKGIPAKLLDKIQKDVSVTEGKDSGHGIGLCQVREALQRHQGSLHIDSQVGEGTTVTVTFPRVKCPDWIAETIELRHGDTVLVLDDDKSIHVAWDSRFESLLATAPDIQLKHFQQAEELIAFVSSLSDDEKNHLFLLTDYELLSQPLNGLDVIKKTQLARKILVTSHYGNEALRAMAVQLGATILPKQLAPEIDLLIEGASSQPDADSCEADTVDLLLVDDDSLFTHTLMRTLFKHLRVACYHNAEDFLQAISQYSKDTRILLDYQLPNGVLGVELAEKLHHSGYTSLYLLSGYEFSAGQLPDYLFAICKTDIEKLQKIFC